MSWLGMTDFIVAGPAGSITAGPPGHFMAGEAGHVTPGEAGHVPIDTTPAHVPIDTSPARIPYSPNTGAPPNPNLNVGGTLGAPNTGGGGGTTNVNANVGGGATIGGGGGGTTNVNANVGGGTGISGGGTSVVGRSGGTANTNAGGSTGISGTGGSATVASATSGGGRNATAGGGVVETQQVAGGAQYTMPGNLTGGAPLTPVTGGTPVPTTQGNITQQSVGHRSEPSTGGAGITQPSTGGGMVYTSPSGGGATQAVATEKATGTVSIGPSLGISPMSPAGHVQITPSPPPPPIPPGGFVMPGKLSQWHGTGFTHNQNWPTTNWTETHETKGWEPEKLGQFWVPTADGYSEAEQVGSKLDGFMDMVAGQKGQGLDFSQTINSTTDASSTMNIDNDTILNSQETTKVENVTNQDVSYVDNQANTIHQDNSRNVQADMTTERTVQNETNQQTTVENKTQVVNNESRTTVHNDTDQTNITERRQVTNVQENNTVKNVDESQTTHLQQTQVINQPDNSVTNLVEENRQTINNDYSRTIVTETKNVVDDRTVNQFTTVDNSRTTTVDESTLQIVNNSDTTNIFDNTTYFSLISNFGAPERSGGDIFVGNA